MKRQHLIVFEISVEKLDDSLDRDRFKELLFGVADDVVVTKNDENRSEDEENRWIGYKTFF